MCCYAGADDFFARFRSKADIGLMDAKVLPNLYTTPPQFFLNSYKDTVFYYNKRYWIQ